MASVYGLGLIPDITSPCDPRYGVASDLDLPASASILDRAVLGLDQGVTNACVGFAIAQALHIIQPSRGYASASAIYYAARLMDGGERSYDGRMLRDDGCRPRSAWSALAGHGFPDESDWTTTAGTVDVCPAMDVWQEASDADWVASRRILGLRRQAIRQAICQGEPVVCGVAADAGLMDLVSGTWTFRGPLEGWHMLTIVGYDGVGVQIANSWGERWGLGGWGWISWEQIESEWTSDLSVPEVRS